MNPVRLLPTALLAALIVPGTATSPGATQPQPAQAQAAPSMTPEEIIAALRLPENSTGNVADGVEEVTGGRGWMSPDMKPIAEGKIVGRAWTATMRPVLKSDTRTYPNYLLQVLDEAPAGSVLVYKMDQGLDIAAIGNLMATTAKVRGLEGTVIDGAVRDVTEIRRLGHKVFARRISPATSVGRMVSVAMQTPVEIAEVTVHPGDYIVGDADGVVVVPQAAAARVVEVIATYNDKESKMVPIIEREKSMRKALEIYGRY